MKQWKLLDEMSKQIMAAEELPPALFSAIVSRLEDSLASGSRDEVLSLERHLAAFLKAYTQKSSSKVIDALRYASNADVDIAAAFALGQISLAQLIAAEAGNRRVGQEFEDVIKENSLIVLCLLEKDRSGLDIAASTGLRPETISRKLKLLRDIGVVDFYREGTSLLNFLTPAAKQIAASLSENLVSKRLGGSAVRLSVNSHRKQLPQHMRGPLTFASPDLLSTRQYGGARS